MQSDEHAGSANDNHGGVGDGAPTAEPHPALRSLARLLARQAARDFVDQVFNDNGGAESHNEGE